MKKSRILPNTDVPNPVDESSSSSYLSIDIESAHLVKGAQLLGQMDPFVVLSCSSGSGEANSESSLHSTEMARTPTHWDARKDPVWFHECPPIPIPPQLSNALLILQVFNDSTNSNQTTKHMIGQAHISMHDVLHRTRHSKVGSLGTCKARIQLELSNTAGTLVLQVQLKDGTSSSRSLQSNDPQIDPSWFETPVERIAVSGGTAPFFKLALTDEGLKHVREKQQQSSTTTARSVNKTYFIGKDLSHAQDEREFYEQIRRIQMSGDESQGVSLLIPFMFDYLGVLQAPTIDDSSSHDKETERQLLVMQNLRNDYNTFRMLDLKMSKQTAVPGWQGKSRFRALKQSLLDGMTNSVSEGYRLEGFDGCPERLQSMDPLMDILASEPNGEPQQSTSAEPQQQNNYLRESTKKTIWGTQVKPSQEKKARRLFLQTLKGADIFRYFMDVHCDDSSTKVPSTDQYLPIEAAEIALHELVLQLVRLAVTCHRVQVPQKWIGSSVALGYDAGLSPEQRSAKDEQTIRSRVIVKLFDWGRSELLTQRRYQAMSSVDQMDRQRFWDYYKTGMDHLAYNATRTYYQQFTNATRWTQLTLQVMDFDSLTADDYIGKVVIPLPDPSSFDTTDVVTLHESRAYPLVGDSTLSCSISWLALPSDSRLAGVWRVTIEGASSLPCMDPNNSSDPYCIVIAQGRPANRELRQMTCVKPRCLNPEWNETMDVPVVRQSSALVDALESEGVSLLADTSDNADAAQQFHFQGRDVTEWSNLLGKAAEEGRQS